MQAMRLLTKKELRELLEREYGDFDDKDVVASFFTCLGADEKVEQQCLMFHKELKSWED